MTLKAYLTTDPLARLRLEARPLCRVEVPPFPRAIPANALQGADGSFLMGADGSILTGAGT